MKIIVRHHHKAVTLVELLVVAAILFAVTQTVPLAWWAMAVVLPVLAVPLWAALDRLFYGRRKIR